MNKTDRLALLKNRHAALFGVALVGLLPVSRNEIRGEARATKARVAVAMDDSTSTGDENSLSSQLQFDAPTVRAERESDVLLSDEERAQLAREMPARVATLAPSVAIETNETFAPQAVEEFVPALPKEWNTPIAIDWQDEDIRSLNLVE